MAALGRWPRYSISVVCIRAIARRSWSPKWAPIIRRSRRGCIYGIGLSTILCGLCVEAGLFGTVEGRGGRKPITSKITITSTIGCIHPSPSLVHLIADCGFRNAE
jgi:hypothetical protein